MKSFRKPYSIDSTRREGETIESHESFGLLKIHRTNGGAGKLFGSHLENQGHYFTLSIHQAERIHSLSRDWFHDQGQLIEIHMTAAQFAEAITSLNMGGGVPCTIYRVLGEQLESVPQATDTEAKRIRASFKDDVRELVGKLHAGSKKVDELLEKKSLSLADKNEIRGVLRKATQDVRENLPFIVESFQESTEKIMTQAKAEMEAFVAMGLQKLGIEALGKRIASGETPMKILGKGSDDAEDGR